MKVNACRVCLCLVLSRCAVLNKPLEVVTHTTLSGFVAKESLDDAVLNYSAHARHLPFDVTQKHVAG